MPTWLVDIVQLASLVPNLIQLIEQAIGIIKGSSNPSETAKSLHAHLNSFTDLVGAAPDLVK